MEGILTVAASTLESMVSTLHQEMCHGFKDVTGVTQFPVSFVGLRWSCSLRRLYSGWNWSIWINCKSIQL